MEVRVKGLPQVLRAGTGRESAHQEPAASNYFTEMCSGSEAGSYFRRIDFCITQL